MGECVCEWVSGCKDVFGCICVGIGGRKKSGNSGNGNPDKLGGMRGRSHPSLGPVIVRVIIHVV